MGLIINQGKQDTSKDNSFDIIVSENEVAQIVKVEIDEKYKEKLKVTMKIISEGKNKGRLLWDRVPFTGEYSWAYRNLRKAASVPYVDSESPKIDIEALLVNKAVTVKLGVRKGDDGSEYQDIKYKMVSTKAPVTTNTKEEEEEENTDGISSDSDSPFDDFPEDTDNSSEW